MKRLFYFLIFFFHFALGEEKYYATHFEPKFRWGHDIAYGTSGRDKDFFREFVAQQLSKFNGLFGNYQNFTYIENSADLLKFERFVEFRQGDPFQCGSAYVWHTKGSYVYFSISPENCGVDEAMGLILQLLGFSNHVRRWDRDRFITLLWDNINPIHASQLYKDYELFNSTDPVFGTFDLDSSMLMSSYSPNAVDPSKPVMKPVENSEANVQKVNLHKSERNVTISDIQQYQAIYKKE